MLACWRFWTPSSRAVTGLVGTDVVCSRQPEQCDEEEGVPPLSPGPSAAGTAAATSPRIWDQEELSPPSLVGSLLPCVICNRTFLPDALSRHQNICQKTAKKKRKVFNSSHQRLQGTGIDPETVLASPSPPPRRRSSSRSSWREKHTQLLNTVRSARGAPVTAPPSAAPPPDYEQCPFCARHFGPKAADRHISWCKEQKSRLPDQRPEAAVAKGRLNARTKYVAPLPLKPRPKRVSAEHVSREASPAVSTTSTLSAAVSATVRSPVRATRDYAKEYREKASQEREQRLQERKKSPASISSGYGKQTPVSRYSREGSEPPLASPPKEAFRRTQSFRRPGAAGRGAGRALRAGKQSAAERKQQQQQQQRHEPDGGEDVAPDRHNYQRSVSSPSERQPTPPRPLSSFASSAAAEVSPSAAPVPAADDEAYITRSQLDEFQRLASDVSKQADYDPYRSAQKQLEELLGQTEPSSPPQSHPSPAPPPYCDAERPSFPSEGSEGVSVPSEPRGQSPGRSAFAQVARPHSALTQRYPLSDSVVKPTPLQPTRSDPIAEAISILNEYATWQRTTPGSPLPGPDDDEEPPSSPESSNTVINKYEFVSNAITRYNVDRESRALRESVSPARVQSGLLPLSHSGSKTGSNSVSMSDSLSKSASHSLSKSASDSRSLSKSASESRSLSKSASESRSLSKSASESRSISKSGSESRSISKSASESWSPTGSGPDPRSSQTGDTEAGWPAGSGTDPWSRSSSVSRSSLSSPSVAAAGGRASHTRTDCLSPSVDSAQSPTNSRSPTNSDAADRRRQAGSPEPPADTAATQPDWTPQQQWRPIESGGSSNRSSIERNGAHPELQFSRLTLDGSNSPSNSLYEADMPDFDLIMEQARRASERKASALSPRKARMRGLDMRQMMGVEVVDMNRKNSAPPTQRFCHECGSGYPVQAARFCCNCGAQRLI